MLKNKTSIVLEWVGHPLYIIEIFSRLKDLGYNVKLRLRDDKLAILGIYTYSEVCTLCDNMYKDSPISMDRKRLRVISRYEKLKYREYSSN